MLIDALASAFSSQYVALRPERPADSPPPRGSSVPETGPFAGESSVVEISDTGREMLRTSSGEKEKQEGQEAGTGENSKTGKKLSEEEQREVEKLKQRDTEVRQHEQAHIAASGGHAKGGASFEYQTGPDGKRYAVGGEVSIDTSPVRNNPDATIQKAQTLKRAALAPAQPSGQDRAVAAAAAKMEQEAQMEKMKATQSGPGKNHPQAASASGKDGSNGGRMSMAAYQGFQVTAGLAINLFA